MSIGPAGQSPHSRRLWACCRPVAAQVVALLSVLLVAPAHAAFVDLSGAWACRKILSDTVTFPLVGELERASTLIQRVTIEQTGLALVLSSAYCSVGFDNGTVLTTRVDQTFTRLLPPVVTAAALDDSTSPARFCQSWSVELHGVRLACPETDALPTDARDPRVFDQDGDGKPGITVRVAAFGVLTGDVYVVQRFRTRLVGAVVSEHRIEGHVEGVVEQVILGATDAVFLGTLTSRPDPVAERSPFVLVRIDAETSCATILSCSEALFDR